MSFVEDFEVKEMPQENPGVWTNRLRKRPIKETKVTNKMSVISKKKTKKRSNKVQPVSHNNNIIIKPDLVKKERKQSERLGSEVRLSPTKEKEVGHVEGNDKERMLYHSFHPEPKTIKQRMENRDLLNAFNEDYEDDLFQSEQKKTRCSLLNNDSDSSSTSSESFNSPSWLSRSPSYPKLERENTPLWYRKYKEESEVNLDAANSFKHVAFIHKIMKNSSAKTKKSTEVSSAVSLKSATQIKEDLASSSNRIAMLSYNQGQQDDSENCEQYFSEGEQE